MTTNAVTNVPFPVYYQVTLQHLNELNTAYRNADADSWPAYRDEVLKAQGLLEELYFLSWEQVDSPTAEDTIH